MPQFTDGDKIQRCSEFLRSYVTEIGEEGMENLGSDLIRNKVTFGKTKNSNKEKIRGRRRHILMGHKCWKQQRISRTGSRKKRWRSERMSTL